MTTYEISRSDFDFLASVGDVKTDSLGNRTLRPRSFSFCHYDLWAESLASADLYIATQDGYDRLHAA